MTALGRFLRKLRIDNDELLYAMAQKIGTSSSFLSAVENGKKAPPVEWIGAISEIYNLAPAQQNELQQAIREAISQIRLNVADQPVEKRDLAIAFARRFDSISSEDAAAVLEILNRRNKERCD